MPGRRFDTEDPPERPSDPAVRKANLRRIFPLFRPVPGAAGARSAALIVFSAAIGVVSPFLLREVLDVAIPDGNVAAPHRASSPAWSRSRSSPGVIGVWQTLLSNQVGQSVMHDLRTRVYRHLQQLSLAFFTRTRTGEVQSRIANDIGGIETVVTSTATSVLSNVTTVHRDGGRDVPSRLAARGLRARAAPAVRLAHEARRRAAQEGDGRAAGVTRRRLLDRPGVALRLRDPAREDDGPDGRPRRSVLGRVEDASPSSRCEAG